MKYILNLSSENISVAGVQLLSRCIYAIPDNQLTRFQNDPLYKQKVKQSELYIDEQSLIYQMREILLDTLEFSKPFNPVDNGATYKDTIDYIANLDKQSDKIKTYVLPTKSTKILKIEEVKRQIETNRALARQHIETKNNDFLNEARELKCNEIDIARDKYIESGVEYKGKVFQSAKKDRDLLTSTTALFFIQGSAPQDFKWIAKDNSMVPMTLQELTELGQLMAKKVSEATYKARQLKDTLFSINSVVEIENVTFS